MIQVVVRSSERVYTVSLEEGADVNDLKRAVVDEEYIPAECIRLVTGTSCLEAGPLTLEEGDFVEVEFDINGGMRAKWRKKRMRRLRKRRRRMRQRAR
jgi:hypothetical protein